MKILLIWFMLQGTWEMYALPPEGHSCNYNQSFTVSGKTVTFPDYNIGDLTLHPLPSELECKEESCSFNAPDGAKISIYFIRPDSFKGKRKTYLTSDVVGFRR